MPIIDDEKDKLSEARYIAEQSLIAKPAVKHVRGGPYEPEMMVGGNQWSAGNPEGSYSATYAVAQLACDEFNRATLAWVAAQAKANFKAAKP